MYKYFLGIDPGMDGALAVLSAEGKFLEYCKMPTLPGDKGGRRIHIYALHQYVKLLAGKYPEMLVCIEKINGTPGQGPTSIFAMGHGCGIVESCVCLADLPYEFVGPQKWKNRYLSGMKGKEASVIQALRLYPEAKPWIVGPRGGMDHNVADAMFIAEYARSFSSRK